MTNQAKVGAFAMLALLLLFGVYYVITDFGTRHSGYRVGVHFRGAAGLHAEALVYFSGVTVGAVDSISLLPDNTVDVILAVNQDVDIPKASKFLIQAPLTGDPNLLIVPPVPAPLPVGAPTPVPVALPMLAREVLPVNEQAQGTNSATIADLLQQGQGEVKRLDVLLADLESREPKLLDSLQTTLQNANALTTTANASMQMFSAKALAIADTMQSSLTVSSHNIEQLTSTLNDTATLNAARITSILTQFQATSIALNKSMAALEGLATDPNLKANVIATTKNIADTTQNIADLTKDMHTIVGDPQTQAQFRNTVANLDATMQRANSLLGTLGGTSRVYGVDAGATPAPIESVAPGANSRYQFPNPLQTVSPSPGAAATPAPTAGSLHLRSRLDSIASNLVAIQLRISALDAQTVCCPDPLFSKDRGPQTDLNAVIFPHGQTNFIIGANDIGYDTTANLAMTKAMGKDFRLGGGILYSRLGVLGQFNAGAFGLDAEVYDLRRPAADLIGHLQLMPGAQLFFGQRDLNHAERRNEGGVQFQLP